MAYSSNREVHNLILRCINPLNAVRTGIFCTKKIFKKLFHKTKEPQKFYPPAAKAAWQKINRHVPVKNELINQAQNIPLGPADIHLTDRKINIGTYNLWLLEFPDIETTDSLHRWAWLIRAFKDRPAPSAEWGIYLMRSWLSARGVFPTGVAAETYSFAERIVNCFKFFGNFDGLENILGAIPDDIQTALFKKAIYVADHLEYRGRFQSGNHAVQNARALLFFGQVFNRPDFSALALEVLKERLPILITEDGFLNQGSSHYQLLFTSWLWDLKYLGKAYKNQELNSIISEYLPKLTERCKFLAVTSKDGEIEIPYIGDISPDISPAELLESLAPCLKPISSPKINWEIYRQSFWYRLNTDRFVFFWYVEPGLERELSTHSHIDLGSFVLFVDGRPFIIDPGRSSYMHNDKIGSYGLGPEAHNTLCVDDFAPVCRTFETRLPPWYRRSEVSVEIEEKSGKFAFIIAHSGFSRIFGDEIQHTRRFEIDAKRVSIEDNLQGRGKHELRLRYHFASHLQLQSDEEHGIKFFDAGTKQAELAINRSPNSRVLVLANQRAVPLGGICSRVYGHVEASSTVEFQANVQLPLKLTSEFNFGCGDK